MSGKLSLNGSVAFWKLSETFTLVSVATTNSVLIALLLVFAVRFVTMRKTTILSDVIAAFDTAIFVPMLAMIPVMVSMLIIWLPFNPVHVLPQGNPDKCIAIFVTTCTLLVMWITLRP